MRSSAVAAGDTSLLVLDPGDEAMSSIESFARERNIDGARVWGIGGFSEARVAFFDRESKSYRPHQVDRQAELLSLHGNISMYGDDIRLHLHAVLGLEDGTARGGHLEEATVWPTLEVFVVEVGRLEREMDEETGLPLLRP